MHKTKSELKREAEQDDTQRIEEFPGEADLAEKYRVPAPPHMSDGVPYWEGYAAGHEHGLHWPTVPPPHGTYRQITIIENTNDKEWMHRNMDLTDFGKMFKKEFEKLWQFAALFAVGMVMMGVMIWILA